MIAPRKSPAISAPKRPENGRRRLQINRLFDTEAELTKYLNINFKEQKPTIVRQWTCEQIACEIELSDKPKEEKKKK